MATTSTLTDSLRGRALFIRNLLRGGVSTDDETLPVRLIEDNIVSTTAEVLQAELDRRYGQYGQELDSDMLRAGLLHWLKDDFEPETPVVLLKTARPASLHWNGQPAIRFIKSEQSMENWGVAGSQAEAIRKATGQLYEPGAPTYWIDADQLRAALPLAMGLTRKTQILYIPARINQHADGSQIDRLTDRLPLSVRLWNIVWREVYKNMGGTLLQTQTNRDEVNNGADSTVPART